MKQGSTQTSVVWGELYPTLTAIAESQGISRAEVAREALRAFAEGKNIETPARPEPTTIDNTSGKIFVRIGKLIMDLETRAINERRSVSVIVRKAIRYYLADMRVLDVKEYALAIKEFGEKFARIGGNLNQIALKWNAEDEIDEAALSQVHKALIAEFRRVIEHLKGVRHELAKQNA